MLAITLSLVLGLNVQAAQESSSLSRLPDGRYHTDVTIDGRGPWPFIVDTGASHTAIADVLAFEFGYVPSDIRSDVQTLTEEIRLERLQLGRLQAVGLTQAGINAVVIDTPTDLDLQMFGLLGNDMFAGHIVRFDLAAGTLTAGAASPRYSDASLNTSFGVPIGQAILEGAREPVSVMIDTGSARTIVNSMLYGQMRRDGLLLSYDVLGASRIGRLERSSRTVRLENFRIGGVCGSDLQAVSADVDMFRALGWTRRPAMIVGVDALADAVLTLDHETGRVEISPADGQRCD